VLRRLVHAVSIGLAAILRRIWWPVLLVAIIGWSWSWLAGGIATFTGDHDAPTLWRRIAVLVGVTPVAVRLAVFVPLQVGTLVVLHDPLRRARAELDRVITPLWSAVRARSPTLVREGAAIVLLVGLLLLVVPLLLQPTMVPWRADRTTWLARSANWVDGRALARMVDGAVVLVRWWQARPVPGMYSVDPADLDVRGLDAPLMARWDPILTEVTRDREHFAQTKAFLYVESAGRQYAVSRTGCAGLMQFCVSTANRHPFRQIFGVGQVSACDCGGRPCTIPSALRDALETDRLALQRHPGQFPCSPSDARFDGRKALTAGAAYTTELGEAVGGNLYLMYIGYNSGPAVAKRLWIAVGRNPNADLDDLRPHLATVLARWYGAKAPGRAQGLLDVHLPKLKRAYDHYR
jgi:hypothetical protein